jgi:putative transcriptional regulator
MSLKGQLLVALPLLNDPNFQRSVIFLIEHNDEGALGVIINRPLDLDATDLLERWGEVFAGSKLSQGGPVSTDSAICLGVPRAVAPGDETTEIVEGLVAVNLEADPAIATALVEKVRVFIGYAGWGAGQLEAEIEEGAWFVCDGGPDDVFSDDPARIYERVLRRQSGQMRFLATYPMDPRMN